MFTSVRLGDRLFSIQSFGPSALLLKPVDAETEVNCPFIGQQIVDAGIKGINEVIPSEKEILLRIDPKLYESVFIQLKKINWKKHSTTQLSRRSDNQQPLKLPVCFDEGPDWPIVEQQTGRNRQEIITQLTQTPFRMAMYGFMPGFLYLSGLPPRLHCDRKERPRQHVPTGAVGIGGPYLGCYGRSSPGGWQLIGNCPLILFDHSKIPPTGIRVGDLLSIEVIDAERHCILRKQNVGLVDYAQLR